MNVGCFNFHAEGTCTSSNEENKRHVSDNQMDKMMSTPPSKKIKRENSTDSLFGMPSSSYKSESSDSELLEPIKLPPFTPTVKIALRDGDCNESVWKMVRAWIMYIYSGHHVMDFKTKKK